MKIKIKGYTLQSKVNIKKQNNSRWMKYKPINNIGFIYNCVFKQRKAFEYSLHQIRQIYPESRIYAVSDGGFNYSYLEEIHYPSLTSQEFYIFLLILPFLTIQLISCSP